MLSRSTFIAAMSLIFLVPAASAGLSITAETETPADTPRMFIAESALWKCEGSVCEAELSVRRPTLKTCKKVAREIGRLSAFHSEDRALNARNLEKCNREARSLG